MSTDSRPYGVVIFRPLLYLATPVYEIPPHIIDRAKGSENRKEAAPTLPATPTTGRLARVAWGASKYISGFRANYALAAGSANLLGRACIGAFG